MKTSGIGMAPRRITGRPAPSGGSVSFLIKILQIAGVFVLVSFIVLAGAAGFFAYRVSSEHNDVEAVTPDSYLLKSEDLSFSTSNGGEHKGWLLRGLRGAPVIIICHGYGSNRSDGLSLGTVLQENHFNVYLFNFRGSKSSSTMSDLGPSYTEALKAAIQKVTSVEGINPRRIGLVGRTTGAYAALGAAEQSPLVKVLVMDSVYAIPDQMFDAQMADLLGGSSSGFFHGLAEAEFHLVALKGNPPDLGAGIAKLGKIPKLFIAGRDSPALMAATQELYQQAPQPKQLLLQEHTQLIYSTDSEKKEYADLILNFFLQRLPLRAD
jgi:pimeloyl-ACP methyl ester carboxylesterase